METSQANLLDERKNSELREQFIAVLGHDLRNPLAAIDAGCRMLMRTPLDPKASTIVGLIQTSVVAHVRTDRQCARLCARTLGRRFRA